MKIAIHFTKGNWHTFKKVKAIATTDNFVILTKLDGDVKVFDRNQVRKYMNQLKKDELVKIGYLPTSAFDEELSLPIKGFCITNKAKELEQYKIAEKAEHETLKRVFGI